MVEIYSFQIWLCYARRWRRAKHAVSRSISHSPATSRSCSPPAPTVFSWFHRKEVQPAHSCQHFASLHHSLAKGASMDAFNTMITSLTSQMQALVVPLAILGLVL